MLELLRQSLMCFFFIGGFDANRRTAVVVVGAVAQQTVTLPLLMHCRLFDFMRIEDEHSRYGNYCENSKILLLYVDCHRDVCGSRSPSAAVLWIFRILRIELKQNRIHAVREQSPSDGSFGISFCIGWTNSVRHEIFFRATWSIASKRTAQRTNTNARVIVCAREIMGKKYCMRNPSARCT